MSMEYFDRLGVLIGQRWKAHHCNETSFPEVAVRALEDLPAHRHVTMWDIARNAITAPWMPQQLDPGSKFGDPPLTVYYGRGFVIDVLFWAEGTPSIHQHAFSGAFQVLQGSSVHTLWEFNLMERVETHLLLGQTQLKSAEVLLTGDLRPILPGKQMIHATYHLEHPSITLVVRTVSQQEHRPQYDYLPPGIAFDQNDHIPLVKRQTELLRMLLVSGKRAQYYEMARHVCETADAYSVFRFITETYFGIHDEEFRQILLLSATRRHPVLIEALRPVLTQMEIGHRVLQARRNRDLGPEMKFFLALLRNVPNRAAILTLIQQRYPNRSPTVHVRELIRKLSNAGLLGVRFTECWLVAIEGLLQGLSNAELLALMPRRCPPGSFPSTQAQLRDLTSGLQEYWLLQPLLASAGNSEGVRVSV